ncbi:hypothetical protein sr10313 [Sporisorium reilianum SRZ2]|uniref:Uncharacterized protein n=1 Tax=Sporisorium reilianum (strain SRZ2) TaxID=999809 RepID=E6ZTT8_SPORE|nr:hypothetical protein sr10313 [Sporisorium reilianum SRZ2]
MHCALLFRALCLLFVSSLCPMVASPPPPMSSPYWLEDFLAMDWRDAVSFSKQMAESGSTHPATASETADAASSTVPVHALSHPPALAVQVAPESRRLVPSPSSLDSRNTLPARADVQTQGAAAIPDADPVSYASSNAPASVWGQESTAGPSIPQVSDPLVAGQSDSLATLPDIIHLPTTYAWLSSDQLIIEMEHHVLGLDDRLLEEMSRLSYPLDSIPDRLPTVEMFRANSRAYAVELTSGVVFVKFVKPHKFVRTDLFQAAMTIWSLEVQNARHHLALRGVWGIPTGVQMAVMESLSSVKFIVRKGLDFTGGLVKFLERDDLSPAPAGYPTWQ